MRDVIAFCKPASPRRPEMNGFDHQSLSTRSTAFDWCNFSSKPTRKLKELMVLSFEAFIIMSKVLSLPL